MAAEEQPPVRFNHIRLYLMETRGLNESCLDGNWISLPVRARVQCMKKRNFFYPHATRCIKVPPPAMPSSQVNLHINIVIITTETQRPIRGRPTTRFSFYYCEKWKVMGLCRSPRCTGHGCHGRKYCVEHKTIYFSTGNAMNQQRRRTREPFPCKAMCSVCSRRSRRWC